MYKVFITVLLLAAVTQVAANGGQIFEPTGIYAEKQEATVIPPKAVVVHNYSRYPAYYVDGHNTPDNHLINTHHVPPSELIGLSQDQKNRLHGKMHTEGNWPSSSNQSHSTVKSFFSTRSAGGCPNGQCPISRRRR